jgi:hypothetical protein
MYQKMYYDWERPTDTLTLDIYPNGKSEYIMYEDDGLTREHRKGIFAVTKFEVTDNRAAGKPMEVLINPAEGDFRGRLKQRVYLLEIHTAAAPQEIRLQGKVLRAEGKAKRAGKRWASGGWSFDAGDRGGMLKIRTGSVSTDAATTVTIR